MIFATALAGAALGFFLTPEESIHKEYSKGIGAAIGIVIGFVIGLFLF